MPTNEQKLSFIVDLIDDTQAKFKEIAANLNAMQNQTKETASTLKSMEPAFRGMVEVGTVAFAAIAGEIYVALKATENAQVQMSRFNATLDAMGPKAQAAKAPLLAAAEATEKFGFDNDDAEVALARMYQRTGDVTEAIKLNNLAMDLARAKNIDLTTASNLVNLALSGAGRALLQYGIHIKDIATPMEALSELQKAVGGQAAAFSETLAGKMQNLKVQTDNLQKSIGAALSPAISVLLDKILPVIEKMTVWMQANPQLTATILAVAGAAAFLTVALGTLGLAMIAIESGSGVLGESLGGLRAAIVYASETTVTWSGFLGIMGGALTAVRAAVMGVALSFTTLSGAMMTTGIGAVIVLAGVLIKAFMDLTDTVGGFGNAFTYIWLEVKKGFADAMLGMVQGLQDLLNKIPGIHVAFDDVIKGFKEMAGEADTAQSNISESLLKTGKDSKTGADDMSDAALQQRLALEAVANTAKATAAAAKQAWNDMVGAVRAVRDEIKTAYDDMTKATNDYLGKVGNEQTSYQNSIVDTVAQAQKDITDLTVQQNSARAKGDYQSVTDLGNQIQQKQAIIISYHSMQLNLDQEIADKQKYLNMNALQQLQADHDAKLKTLQEEFLQTQVTSLQKIVVLTEENNRILALVGKQKQAKLEADVQMAKSARDRYADEASGLTTFLSQSLAQYTTFAARVKATMNSISVVGNGGFVNPNANYFGGGRASGGSVSGGTTYLVGENGPELFTPENSGNITANSKMGGNSITIVIQGNSFMSKEDFADEVSDTVMRQLKQNIKL